MSVVADSRRLLRASRVRGSRAMKQTGPVVLPLLMAALVAAGWSVDLVALAGILALELALAGLGTAALLGAARPNSGYARYAIFAVSAVSVTLAGRLLPPGIGPLAAPLAWAFLFWVLYIERHGPEMPGYRLSLDVTLVLTVFSATAGMASLLPAERWPCSVSSSPSRACGPRRPVAHSACRRSARRRSTCSSSCRSRRR
jgi:hypothetical protein